MFLKRIELQGFKSFADKTILQFDHDITGIVGPNGCGKSNVNDAIRWVLGEQSVKSLRGGSAMSDIIFSGSEYRKPVNMAKVTLVFDNTNRVFDSEFEEIEITRQLQRSTNEANYFINKTPCRLKDISELVMDTGLGRDSLSIITQGNISSFADAKPEDRRSLFEEAAGVAKYKKRKQLSLHKLEKTRNNLDRLQDIIDELERQLKPLEKQAKKAKTFVVLKSELSQIEISVLVEEIEAYHSKIQKIQQEQLEKKSIYISQENELEGLDSEIEITRKEMYALDVKVNTLQGEYTKTMSESYQLEKRKIEMDEKRKYALSQASQQERKEQLMQMVKESEYEYEDRKNRLIEMRANYDLEMKNFENLKSRVGRIHNERNQANSIVQQLSNRKQILENMMQQPYQHQGGVRSIMNAKQSLPGIEGVISELLVPHDDMADAVQAALGGSLYQIVTIDESSARNAIRFLKRNRSGRATFLPMTICTPRYVNDQQAIIAAQTPGFIAFANECVDCPDLYNNVRDRLLGHVVVVDTLENANECAKRLNHRVKIVTLDGEIVHTGGSMTGGKGKNQSSPLTMRQELDSVDMQLAQAQNKYNDLHAQEQKMHGEMDQSNQKCIQIKVDLARLENVFDVKKQKYESLKDEYQQLTQETYGDETALTDELVVRMSKMHARIDDLTSQIQDYRQRRYEAGVNVEEKENQVRMLRREMNHLQTDIHKMEVSSAKFKTQLDNMLMRLNSDYEMTYEYARTKKEDVDIEQAKDRVSFLREEISKLGNINLDASEEFEKLNERYTYLMEQKEDLEKASHQIMDAIDEMDTTMVSQFTDMFDKINKELDGVFKSMFGGGRAKLSMVDPHDVLNTGIDIDAQPPGKMVKNIRSFSGGEKALIAICVLFSILQARTMPLCIFDEVEAALDQANVERFARYIGHFRGKSQFMVVTHRPGTMEQCDTLFGVTMQKDGVSKLLKVELRDALHIAESEGDSDGVLSKN